MKFDKAMGIWKDFGTAIMTPENWAEFKEKVKVTDTEQETENESDIPEQKPDVKANRQEPKIEGLCVLTIRIDDEHAYEKWVKYNPGRKWEYLVSYPALMRAEYRFSSSMDVEILVKKVVQLLQMGFDVYSAQWTLGPVANAESTRYF